MFNVFISFSTLFFCLGLDQWYVREYHGANNKLQLFKESLVPGFMSLTIVVLFLIFFDVSLSELVFDYK
ncbi:Uncharacterised protein [Shewanella baltica]|nr:Uncharacterised protein [Shewanella baltica]